MALKVLDSTQSDREILVSHLIDAPRELAFKAWTDPDRLRQWWGVNPDDITADLEVKPSGYWSVSVRAEDGKHWFRGVFQQVSAPDLLKFTLVWHGPHGHTSLLTRCTLAFEDLGGSTRLTFHQSKFDSRAQRDEYLDGWLAFYARFAAYVEETWQTRLAA